MPVRTAGAHRQAMEMILDAVRDPPDLVDAMSSREGPVFQFPPPIRVADPLAKARHILACRDRRFRHLPADLFGEPAWDLLLTLYVARHEQRRVD